MATGNRWDLHEPSQRIMRLAQAWVAVGLSGTRYAILCRLVRRYARANDVSTAEVWDILLLVT